MENTGIMEIRGARVVDEELERGRGPEKGEEGVVVDKERAGLWGGGGEDVRFVEGFSALVDALGLAIVGCPLLLRSWCYGRGSAGGFGRRGAIAVSLVLVGRVIGEADFMGTWRFQSIAWVSICRLWARPEMIVRLRHVKAQKAS